MDVSAPKSFRTNRQFSPTPHGLQAPAPPADGMQVLPPDVSPADAGKTPEVATVPVLDQSTVAADAIVEKAASLPALDGHKVVVGEIVDLMRGELEAAIRGLQEGNAQKWVQVSARIDGAVEAIEEMKADARRQLAEAIEKAAPVYSATFGDDGLPVVSEVPQIVFRGTRPPENPIMAPPRPCADGIILYYNYDNKRPQPEIRVTQQGVVVDFGMAVEVPPGWVCDVTVAGTDGVRVRVATLAGRSGKSLVLRLHTDVPGGYVVANQGEIARLHPRRQLAGAVRFEQGGAAFSIAPDGSRTMIGALK